MWRTEGFNWSCRSADVQWEQRVVVWWWWRGCEYQGEGSSGGSSKAVGDCNTWRLSAVTPHCHTAVEQSPLHGERASGQACVLLALLVYGWLHTCNNLTRTGHDDTNHTAVERAQAHTHQCAREPPATIDSTTFRPTTCACACASEFMCVSVTIG